MGASGRTPIDLAALGRRGFSTFLWGESRSAVNRVLYLMVHAADPEYLWLDLSPGRSQEDPGPVELGWVPKERRFVVDDPYFARPQDAVANLALTNVVRADESSGSLERVADFMRLAPIAQEIISRVDPEGPPHALAISNSDNVRPDYPHTVEGIRPIVSALAEAPLVPYIAAQGTPGAGRMAFSYVFEVRAKDVLHWRDGALVPEKAPAESGIPVLVPIPLASIPGIEEVFRA